MKQKNEKLHKNGWKSRFVRLTSMLMLCFNVLSAPLTAIGIATLAVTSVTLVVSCDKDDQNQQQEPQQPQKHNVELVYGDKPSTNWQNISMDTLNKYNADPTVDTIFMIPERYQQFNGLSTSALQECASRLRTRHNVNPNKIFGKGNLELAADAVQNHPEITRFFADTLRYNVTTR